MAKGTALSLSSKLLLSNLSGYFEGTWVPVYNGCQPVAYTKPLKLAKALGKKR